MEQPELVRTLKAVLLLVAVLVLIFGVSSYAFIRWSRRYRKWLMRRDADPTPSDDVWQMHRLPDDDDDEEEQRGPDGPGKE
mgnify:CR=1 FL=1